MLLKDKKALVTGGARGIGRAIVEAMLAEGAKVAFNDIEIADDARAFCDAESGKGRTCKALVGDVTSTDDAERVIDEAVEALGGLDILVNNAGIIRDQLALTMPQDDFASVLEVNLVGTFTFSQAAVRHMLREHAGSIVNISSVASLIGGRGQTNYAASKGGVNAFTRALASEVASKGIRVNAVAPGMIQTAMSESVRSLTEDKIKKTIPMRRYGQVEDIADLVVFLASDRAGYITGQVMVVDGGLTLGPRW